MESIKSSGSSIELGINTTDQTPEIAAILTDKNSNPPPDGGLRAWSQAFMGHLVLINSWGYLTSFGLFESYYIDSLGTTPSAISWIGSVQIFLVYFVGTFSGRALDAGFYQTILIIGSFLQVLAVFMTSISTKYWQVFLAQGICKGLGDGMLFCPTVSLVATYFSKKRALAMACTAAGGATGGIIFPLIAQQLLPKIGFGWTVRVMGFVILFNAAVAIVIARVRLAPRRLGPLIEWSAFREPSYSLYCVGMFFNLWAVYFAYFYVSWYLGFSIASVSRLMFITDQHFRQKHTQSIVSDIFHDTYRYERCWRACSLGMWPYRGSPFRTSQYPHNCGFPVRCAVILLGCSIYSWWPFRFLCHIWNIRRWCTKPFPGCVRKSYSGSKEDGCADWHVLHSRFYRLPNRTPDRWGARATR